MIGLIFGETNFPQVILKKIKKKKIKYVIIDLTKKNKFKNEKNSYRYSITQFGKIIEKLKEKKCSKVIFAGKVKKPNLSFLKFDLKGIRYLTQIIKSYKKGDAAILQKIIEILKKEKIKTISSVTFNSDLALKKGNYTKIKPNKKDNINIQKAVSVLGKLNDYDYRQAIVVKNNRVIAIEGKSGTEKMLKQCSGREEKLNGILAKFPKKKQDLRVDLPTIGLKTLIQCKSAGLKGIVLKSKQNIFLEKKKSIIFANRNKMFIKVK
jgi:UDP-2,3-diacylglucosamine hydrolase